MPAITKQFYLLATICLLAATASHAQLKIGTNATTINAASLLEMESTNKGLVLPRVSLTALATAAPLDASLLDGTLVYNTNASVPGGVGIYIWRTTPGSWQQLVVSGNASTTLNGAYNFGGAGAGRTITANTGAVKIDGSDGLLVTGSYNGGASIEASGAGTRMFFNPRKAAFRVGGADSTEWDDANVGQYSIAMGAGARASAYFSTSIGASNQATGAYSMAMGRRSTASSNDAITMGYNNQATGAYSMAMGTNSTASGNNATTTGYNNQATGANSIAMGHTSIAGGQSAMASGHYVQAKSYGGAAVGAYNNLDDNPNASIPAATDRIFQIGNGESGNRRNAITMLRNGRTGLSTIAPAATLHVAGTDGLLVTGTYNSGASIEASGAGTRMFFNPRKAAFRAGKADSTEWDDANVGQYSFAMGAGARASAYFSTSIGAGNQATGAYSMAMGTSSTASGNNATTTGYNNQAIGANSIAMGHTSIAGGQSAMASGHFVQAKSYGGATMGAYNDTTDAPNGTTAAAADRIFQIGNGDGGTRRNALTVLRNGNTGIGVLAPQQKLEVNGQIKIMGGSPGTGKVLTSDMDGVATWVTPAAGITGITLDQAYDFGGAGSGRTITADGGAVKIAGNDGLVVSGQFGTGATIETFPTGGPRMFFNPRKAAFRAGSVIFNQWDNGMVGDYSTAMGINTTAAGTASIAMGSGAYAVATYAVAMGGSNSRANADNSLAMINGQASGNGSVAIGNSALTSGESSFALGAGAYAQGNYSMALGNVVAAKSVGGLAVGLYNDNADNPNTGTAAATDRIFQLGNGTASTRSNAITILRNGNTGIGVLAPQQKLEINGQIKIMGGSPGTGKVLTSDVDGVASWVTPVAGITGITLDQAYDFGGAGAGRTITADGGAVKIAGNDGLLVTGTVNSGATIEASGAGTRMFFNPRKAAFRAGRVLGDVWDDANIGAYSTATGVDTKANGNGAVALGNMTIASGDYSVAMGELTTASGATSFAAGKSSRASGRYSAAMGFGAIASGEAAVAMGSGAMASNGASFAVGSGSIASGLNSTAMGNFSVAGADYSFVAGSNATASGDSSVAIGSHVTSQSKRGLSMGSYNDISDAPTTTAAATDRIFQLGNGTGTSTRSNAITVLRNGRTGISSLSPSAGLHVAGADGLLVTGTYGSGANIEVGGAGTRMFFNPKKAAFRAGAATLNQWDNGNIGDFSTGMGVGVSASGYSAVAMGSRASASGYGAVAIGSDVSASNNNAVALGIFASASGVNSFAIGYESLASTPNSIAMGNNESAVGSYSTAIGGYRNVAFGDYSATLGGSYNYSNGIRSITIGSYCSTDGNISTAIGYDVAAKSYGGFALGIFNDNSDSPNGSTPSSTDRIFQVGNGTTGIARSNAITVLRNGNTGIGVTNPATHKLEVNGSVRQTAYSSGTITVPANGAATYVWNHNLGYQPIIMISMDQTGGGYMDYCNVTYGHNSNNQLTIYLTNRNGSNSASGTIRWIVVY